jgi:hypothetical protein
VLRREDEPRVPEPRVPELRVPRERVPRAAVLREPERDPEPRALDRDVELRELVLRELDRDLLLLDVERDRVPERLALRRRRVVVARWPLGTSARTTSFTSRANSASRYFAIRSSSRLIDLASCVVSRSPTCSAKV